MDDFETRQMLAQEKLKELTASPDLTELSYADLVDDFRQIPQLADYRPTGICRVDPRNGDRVIYSPKRGSRPTELRSRRHVTSRLEHVPCPVCEGNTTLAIDVARLSRGFTFINKNAYPIVSYDFPGNEQPATHEPDVDRHRQIGTYAQGGHWLQWLSTIHDADFHNMEIEDITIVLKRLAVFEGHLLRSPGSNMPVWTGPLGRKFFGFVCIIRNYGTLGGASLAHGHLQIAHTNVLPRAILDDRNYFAANKRSFGDLMLSENPAYLNIRDFGDRIRFCVPYFMKRPYSSIIIPKDHTKSCLHQLDEQEIGLLAVALSTVTRGVKYILEELLDRAFAYNLVFHNGPVGTMYIEVVPHSQEVGGFEQMGWYICQSTPVASADVYREAFRELGI